MDVKGGDGGDATLKGYESGGAARVSSRFQFMSGDQLILMVGEKGKSGGYSGGGGGGSAVILVRDGQSRLLLVAGGGGGGGYESAGQGGQGLTTSTSGGAGGSNYENSEGAGGGGGYGSAGGDGEDTREGSGGAQASLTDLSVGGKGDDSGGSGFGGGGGAFTVGTGGGGGGYSGGDGGSGAEDDSGFGGFGGGSFSDPDNSNVNTINGLDGQIDTDENGRIILSILSPNATASISTGRKLCAVGGPVNVTGTVQASGSWKLVLSDGTSATGTGSTFSIPVQPTQTTTYTIASFQDEVGFAPTENRSGSQVVTGSSQGPSVSLTPTSATLTCVSPTRTLMATNLSGATYSFSPGATLTGTNAVTVSESGIYSVTVVTAGGCSVVASSTITSEKTAPAAPTFSLKGATHPILQNTPFVSLSISGCEGGTVSWQGPNGTSGSGTTLSVPTSTTCNMAYSATCQVGSCVSLPASLTITISPSLVSGSFDGFVNGADCSTFRGWAWDRNKVSTAVSVDILDGATVIGTLLAGEFRQDLLDAGKGNGKHAFRFTIPESVKDGLSHNLSARVSGSSFILKDSPKALVCQGTSSPTNKAPVPPSPTVLVAPLSAQVGVPFSGTLAAFTDPENQPLTYALAGLPAGLSINMSTRVISGTPTQSGTFVLAYSASEGVLTNSVSFPLTVNPQSTTTVTGSFEGYLDKVECGTIRGWVWDRKLPNTPVTVEFYTGTTVWGSVVANSYRSDLKDAGKGNGAHAYSFTVPSGLKDGNTRLIYGRVQGSTFVLKDSGKPLVCAPGSPARLSSETASSLQVTVLGNPVSDQVVVEVRGAEGQTLRLQLTDLSGRLVAERQIEQAGAVERQTLPVGSQPAGLLLMRATSGQQSVTLKVLKP